MKWFKRRTIFRNNRPYLNRFILFKCKWFGIYLHNILEADPDLHLHDHPWNFVTLILSGGYKEELAGGWQWNVAGSVAKRKLGDYHRIAEVFGGTWSLIFIGRTQKDWGFLVNGDHVPHKQYLHPKDRDDS
jgi:hypothetical protein